MCPSLLMVTLLVYYILRIINITDVSSSKLFSFIKLTHKVHCNKHIIIINYILENINDISMVNTITTITSHNKI